jgi:hypothetical protein
MGSLSIWHWIIVAVPVVGIIIALLRAFVGPSRTDWVQSQTTETPEDALRHQAREALNEINRSLGFSEGAGPTTVMLDGKPGTLGLGHTRRLQSDPLNANAYNLAGMLHEMAGLEAALEEATARGDAELASKVMTELNELSIQANALLEQMQIRRGKRE